MNEEDFISLDRKLFDRLSDGPLGPIELELKDGSLIIGDAKGIARGSGGENQDDAFFWGRILLAVDGRDIEVEYAHIADVL